MASDDPRQSGGDGNRGDRFLQALIDTIPTPIFYKDTRGRYLGCNVAFASFCGRDREEIVGRTVEQVWDRASADTYASRDAEILREETPRQEYEYRTRRGDGKLRDVRFSKAPLHDQDGRVIGLAGVMMDITDRKNAERELTAGRKELSREVSHRTTELEETNRRLTHEIAEHKQAEENLRRAQERLWAILETSPDLIFVVNAEGVYVDIFTSGSDLLVAPTEEMIGKRYQDILPRELTAIVQPPMERALQTDQTQTVEYALANEDGELTWQSASVSRFLYGGEVHAVVAVRDITDRVLAEQAARTSEQRLRIILESTPDLMFVLDREGRYIDIFTAESDLLAAPTDELLGRTIHDVLPREIAATCQGIVDAALTTGQPQTHEYDLLLPSGERRWFQARVARFEMQEDLRVVWAARDITDRVQAEQAARASEARFREALRHSQSILYRYNLRAGEYEYISDSVEVCSGYTAEEIRRLGPEAFFADIHPEDLKEVQRQLNRQPGPGDGDQLQAVLQYRRQNKSGQFRWFMDWATLFYEDGELVAVAGSAYDITEQRRAQQELREAHDELERRVQDRTAELAASEERWRSLVETAPDYVLFVDPHGVVRYVNREYPGLAMSEIIGTPIEQFAAIEHRWKLKQALAEALAGAESSGCEARSIGVIGPPRWFDVRFGPVRREGNVIGATIIAQDITERKDTEEALRDVQRRLMRVQEDERRRLAADLHDSVSQMLFALQMRLKRLHNRCDECHRKQDLADAIDQCNQLIHETRAVYRGLYPPGLVQLGLVSALRQLARDFELTTTVNVTPGPAVQASRFDDAIEIALFRIAQEAVRNAVRHGSAKTIDVDLVMDAGRLTLRIADDGTGFDPTSPTADSLGLRTMEERAVSVGGTFHVESGPQGTTLSVSVPANPVPAGAEE